MKLGTPVGIDQKSKLPRKTQNAKCYIKLKTLVFHLIQNLNLTVTLIT